MRIKNHIGNYVLNVTEVKSIYTLKGGSTNAPSRSTAANN